jgi:hypothetical protein
MDAYPTPPWAVHRLLEACPLPGGRWIEPAAGDGAIIRAVRWHRRDILWDALDIREACRERLHNLVGHDRVIGDFIGYPFFVDGSSKYDVLITNPPFSLAMEFLQKGLEVADRVALLLRSNFLGSQGRAEFFREHMPDRYQLPNRPTFVHVEKWNPKAKKGKGGWEKTSGDSVEYEWMVWSRERRSVGTSQVLAITPEADVAAARKLAPVIRVGAGPDEARPTS